jgi:tetratricopeptide (TPR) repeat protein
MIVRDCAHLVAASLECVRNVADEIVVVDTGSTDRTREIAMQRASRVADYKWRDDFAAARNFCLTQLTGDWVFWLDAGETITSAAAAQLRSLADSSVDLKRAFLVMVQTPSAKSEMADEQIGRIRLHPRISTLEFTGRIREELHTALDALGISMDVAPFAIHRTRLEHQPQIKRRKAERNIHLAALEIQDHGVLPAPLLAMADACITLGQIQHGIDFYSRALEVSPTGSTTMLEAFYGVLAALDHVAHSRDKQIALCQQALEVFPFDAQLLCAMASYLQQQNRIDLACRSFEAAARFGQVDPQTSHLIEIADVAAACHATCQELLGDTDGARHNLETSAAAKPNSQRLSRQLLDFYIRHDCRQEALALADRLAADCPRRDPLRSAVRGACLAAKQNWIPALAYLQTAFGAGCRDPICFRGLWNAYLATGDLQAAGRTLAEWRLHHPDSGEVAGYAAQLTRQTATEGTSPRPLMPGGTGPTGDRNLRLDAEGETPAPSAFRANSRSSVFRESSRL